MPHTEVKCSAFSLYISSRSIFLNLQVDIIARITSKKDLMKTKF